MDKKMRKCAVCGTEYSYCPKCGKDNDKPAYFFTFCSEKCHDVYSLTSMFENGQISSVEAKELLDNQDLSMFDRFGQSYKDSIAKIISSVPVVEDLKTEEFSGEMEETVFEEPIKKGKNKRFKKDVE